MENQKQNCSEEIKSKIKVGSKLTLKHYVTMGYYGFTGVKKITRYVKEVTNKGVVVNCKPDFSGKADTKISFTNGNYKIVDCE